MTLPTYLLYLAAVFLLIVTPGPTMLMCMTNALNHGQRPAITSLCGAMTALVGVMALSAMGLGALLAASEAAFTTAKVLGAAYLVYLGIKTFRSQAALDLGEARALPSGRSFFLQGFLVGASNPKAILFFAAFFPQFLNPAAPVMPQFALLAGTFVVLELMVMTACALGVSRIAHRLRDARVVRWINRVCGGLFTVMGGLLLLSRRQA